MSPIVHCGFHALEVINLNVVASNLLRTCFKSQSLLNSIIVVTERHLHIFLTRCSQLKFTNIGILRMTGEVPARLVLVIAWFGGQLRINFLSKILKFFCNCSSL